MIIKNLNELMEEVRNYDMNYSITVYDKNSIPINVLYIDPSTYDGYYHISFIIKMKIIEGSIKPMLKEIIPHVIKNIQYPVEFYSKISERYEENPHFPGMKKQYIYCIQGESGGPIKIGISKQPYKRLTQLQGSNPNNLKIIKVSQIACRDVEKSIQKKLNKFKMNKERKGGEWFEPTSEVLEFIEKLEQNCLDLSEQTRNDYWGN